MFENLPEMKVGERRKGHFVADFVFTLLGLDQFLARLVFSNCHEVNNLKIPANPFNNTFRQGNLDSCMCGFTLLWLITP